MGGGGKAMMDVTSFKYKAASYKLQNNLIYFRNIRMDHHEAHEFHEVLSSVPSVSSW